MKALTTLTFIFALLQFFSCTESITSHEIETESTGEIFNYITLQVNPTATETLQSRAPAWDEIACIGTDANGIKKWGKVCNVSSGKCKDTGCNEVDASHFPGILDSEFDHLDKVLLNDFEVGSALFDEMVDKYMS